MNSSILYLSDSFVFFERAILFSCPFTTRIISKIDHISAVQAMKIENPLFSSHLIVTMDI